MFVDELDRLDSRMRTRISPAGAVIAREEPSRWGIYQVGPLARRVSMYSDDCPTCNEKFLDHKQFIRHRDECAARNQNRRSRA